MVNIAYECYNWIISNLYAVYCLLSFAVQPLLRSNCASLFLLLMLAMKIINSLSSKDALTRTPQFLLNSISSPAYFAFLFPVVTGSSVLCQTATFKRISPVLVNVSSHYIHCVVVFVWLLHPRDGILPLLLELFPQVMVVTCKVQTQIKYRTLGLCCLFW